MISYKNYEQVIEKIYYHKHDHIFSHWNTLNASEKKFLLDDVSGIDFELLERLFIQSKAREAHKLDYTPAPYLHLPKTNNEYKKNIELKELGIDYIKKGRTAVFTVAGGQGSRLGFNGPKGMYPVGAISKKSLFQIHAEKILKNSIKYNVSIPWMIMTSTANHQETLDFLADNRYFGLDRNTVFIFPQNMIPSLDMNGKIILESRCGIFKNPDGHGGSITALASSGILNKIKKMGMEIISYFQVDNPLVNIIDPVFIGNHISYGAKVSSKGVMKAGPEEKVGVFVNFEDGSIGVVEYSDLSDKKKHEKDRYGNLRYCMGNTAIHLFDVAFIESITSGGVNLPYHIAEKDILAYLNGKTPKIKGLKFEKYIFDSLAFSKKSLVIETVRDEEFAPVKNKTGIDSIDTSQRHMNDLYFRWLRLRGIKIPESVKIVEISPLYAIEAEDIGLDLVLPDVEMVYLV